jgi:hypothetical protein
MFLAPKGSVTGRLPSDFPKMVQLPTGDNNSGITVPTLKIIVHFVMGCKINSAINQETVGLVRDDHTIL